MREILFRGKTFSGDWVEGYYCPCCFGYFPCKPAIVSKEEMDKGCWRPEEVIPKTVGQYTGLTDKNGTKIFEGDILKVKTMWHAEFPEDVNGFPVAPIKKETYWSVEHKNFRGEMGFMVYGIDRRWHTKLTWNKLYNSEAVVVGNIHDNPELLGGVE